MSPGSTIGAPAASASVATSPSTPPCRKSCPSAHPPRRCRSSAHPRHRCRSRPAHQLRLVAGVDHRRARRIGAGLDHPINAALSPGSTIGAPAAPVPTIGTPAAPAPVSTSPSMPPCRRRRSSAHPPHRCRSRPAHQLSPGAGADLDQPINAALSPAPTIGPPAATAATATTRIYVQKKT